MDYLTLNAVSKVTDRFKNVTINKTFGLQNKGTPTEKFNDLYKQRRNGEWIETYDNTCTKVFHLFFLYNTEAKVNNNLIQKPIAVKSTSYVLLLLDDGTN